MRRFGSRSGNIARVLAILAAAAAVPAIAAWSVLPDIIYYKYALFTIYATVFIALSAMVLHRRKLIAADRSLEIRAMIYLAIMVSMVIVLEIY